MGEFVKSNRQKFCHIMQGVLLWEPHGLGVCPACVQNVGRNAAGQRLRDLHTAVKLPAV